MIEESFVDPPRGDRGLCTQLPIEVWHVFDLAETVSPDTWEDEGFEIRFAFFLQLLQRTEYESLGTPSSPQGEGKILRGELESHQLESINI